MRKPIDQQTIFISIAAYCDPMLAFTVTQAFKQARYPHNLRFGIVEQQNPTLRLKREGETTLQRVRYIGIDPEQSRGACWARALAMSLYENEDWFFQIDSHMLFEEHWDERLIAASMTCGQSNQRTIVSSYPNAFEIIDGKAVIKPATQQVLGHVLANNSQFEADHPVLKFQAVPVDRDIPVQGFHVGAGCLFANGLFVNEIPYDPQIYFHGEEQTIAARAFTHGWDIYHIPRLPIYHLYNTGEDTANRPLHWTEEHDKARSERWWDLEARSKARVKALLCDGADLGVYGLGRVRTLAQYTDLSGIDYVGKTLGDNARLGPWRQQTNNAAASAQHGLVQPGPPP